MATESKFNGIINYELALWAKNTAPNSLSFKRVCLVDMLASCLPMGWLWLMWCMKHKNHVQKFTTQVMQVPVHVLDTWETLHTKFCYFFAHLNQRLWWVFLIKFSSIFCHWHHCCNCHFICLLMRKLEINQ